MNIYNMAQDYRWGDEVEIKLNSGYILAGKSIFRGVDSYDVRNNASRQLLRKEKGDVKPQDWRNDLQRHYLEDTPRIYQIGEQVDMKINRKWVSGTIENIYYKIEPSGSSSVRILSYLQVHRNGQPWPQPPAPVVPIMASHSEIRRPANIQATQPSIFTFPHTTININNMPTDARDIINATDENISQFIAENPRNKIFKFMNAYHAINANDFETNFLQGEKKKENTFYSCKRAMSGLSVSAQDVYINKPLFSLRNMGFTNYVSMDEIESALQSPNQYFEIIQEGAQIAPSLSSYYSIHGRSNADFDLSNRLHCQEGIQSYIYKLAILDIISTGGKKNKTKKQNKYAKHRNSSRKQKITQRVL